MAVDLKFQFDSVNTILILRDYYGHVIKTSKEIPESFYYMEHLGPNIYRDKITNIIWKKEYKPIAQNECVYFQEEYIDVTAFWNKNQQLLHELKTDGLTEIANVRAVEDKKLEILSLNQSCTLVMSDVNSFKQINDIYGHLIGDQCLIEIAKLFKKYIRPNDLVARIGGDEFLFIFMTDDIESVTEQMKIIQEEVKKLGENLNIPLSICIGIASYQKGDNWDQKRTEADIKSYQNKNLMKKLGSCPKTSDNA